MKKTLRQYAFHVGRVTLHVSRWTLYITAVLLVLLTVLFMIARYLLPAITQEKAYFEQYLSERSGHQVRIESLHAHWDGLNPGARVQGLQVFAADGVKPAVRLSEVRISLALLPLLWGGFEINNLVVVNPSLSLERLADGRFRLSGFDPLAADEQGKGEQFVAWLFQQGRLEIENGELQWFDHREGGQALRLLRANLSLRNNGDRHRLGFSADFPDGMCDECSIHLDVTGNPLASTDWDGEIYLRTRHVNIDALPLIAREKLPPDFRGRFALQLQSEWEQGRPETVRGFARVTGLRLPVPGWSTPLGINQAGGDLVWQARRSGWRLDVANPQFALSGKEWAGGHLRIVYQPEACEFQIKHLDLADLTGFVTRLKKEIAAGTNNVPGNTAALLETWLAVKPEGALDNFDLRLQGDWMSPADFSLETEIRDGVALAHQNYPGARGVSGKLSLARDYGNFRLDAANMTLTLPRVFRQPLAAQRVSGAIAWKRESGFWEVEGRDLRLSGEDGRGAGKLDLRIPHDHALSPVLTLRVDFQDGNGARAARYYPATHLSPATLAWMEQSFLGGEITQGHVIYDGPIREFPFDQGTGKFELRAHVRRGIYRYLPGWEPIRQAEADVALDGSEVLVTGTGKIGRLDATQVLVHSRAGGAGHHVVRVGGKVSGPIGETLKVLGEVKPGPDSSRWLAYLPSGLQGTGDGLLSLDLNIPLSDAHPARLQGEYRFMKNTLRMPGTAAAADSIEGNVRFTETGIRDGSLRARILGGDTVLSAAQQKEQLVLIGQGAITAQGLAPIVGAKIAPRLSGSASWNGRWQWGGGTTDLRAEVDLRDFKLALPPPLDRHEGLGDEKLVIRTESARSDRILLGLSLGRLGGRLAFARQDEVWKFSGGRIGTGQDRTTPLKERELHVSADLDALDLDQWWPLLGGDGNLPASLTKVSANVRALTLFDREFGQLSLGLSRHKGEWSGSVNGASMAGKVQYAVNDSTSSFALELDRLAVPEKLQQRRDVPVDPRRLPSVSLRSKSFEVRGKPLGELDFMATPSESGWRIRRFNLTRPEMKLNVTGNWRYANNAHASEFDIELESANLGATAEAFGAENQVAGGEASVKSHLSWPGPPTTPRLAELNGNLDITAKKGRFVQVKARAGRLFGLLDLSAIGRYLTLDFSPVFGKGFIYDQIRGHVVIEQGNAYTQGFSIRGPATQIDANGRIGLAAEDFDLVIEVQPKLSDTVTIATWGVLGPQVAAAVLAVQKIFKKQIAAGTRITYVVKGPWDNPVVNKMVKGKTDDTAKENAGDAEAGSQ